MAEFLTFDTDLTAVANAIRAKGGTSAQLIYPSGFVSAIQAIQTGITPKLVVTTSAGAAVTAVKGSKTVSGTADTDGGRGRAEQNADVCDRDAEHDAAAG